MHITIYVCFATRPPTSKQLSTSAMRKYAPNKPKLRYARTTTPSANSYPSDLEVLTLELFLIGTSLQAVLEHELCNIPDNRLTHFGLTQKRY